MVVRFGAYPDKPLTSYKNAPFSRTRTRNFGEGSTNRRYQCKSRTRLLLYPWGDHEPGGVYMSRMRQPR